MKNHKNKYLQLDEAFKVNTDKQLKNSFFLSIGNNCGVFFHLTQTRHLSFVSIRHSFSQITSRYNATLLTIGQFVLCIDIL